MSGYFGQLAARALGEPARLAPPPRLRFGDAIDPELTAPPVAQERPAMTGARPHAPIPAAAAPPVVSRERDLPAPTAFTPAQQPPAHRAEQHPQIAARSRPEPPAARAPVVSAPRSEPAEPQAREVEPQPLAPERRPSVAPLPAPVTRQSLAGDVLPTPPPPAPAPASVLIEPQRAAPKPQSPPPPSPAPIPLAPVRAPEPAAQIAQAYERPRVTISIGQIELRAANDKPASSPPGPAQPVRERPRKPGLPLDEYLEQRSRR